MPVLDMEGVSLAVSGVPVLSGIDLAVGEGEIVGLVGASGSGKSMTALSVMRLLPPGSTLDGRIALDGTDLLALSEPALCAIRGMRIGMVFQEPGTALNPLKTIGDQVAESFRLHLGLSRRAAAREAAARLDTVGLPPGRVGPDRFPHELSGGQRQRVVIAIAMALGPRLLLADEPTTALDVTTQAQILALLRTAARRDGAGLLLVSHDLAVIAAMADRAVVLDAGRVVEEGPPSRLLRSPRSAAAAALAEATRHVPRPAPARAAPSARLLSVEGLRRWHDGRRPSLLGPRPRTMALDGVSLDVSEGESVGVVGESGSGKSTLARIVAGLDWAQEGTVRLGTLMFSPGDAGPGRDWHRRVQMVFQDPFGSFDPRHRAGRIVGEPLHLLPGIGKAEAQDRIAAALDEVGLAGMQGRYPHEFSGGQRQRLAIARALITRPDLVVLDEPVSALDVVTRAQILDLLAGLRERHGLAYLFISHDLAVVRAVTERVIVMRDGAIVEEGETGRVLSAPAHAYTRSLAEASLALADA